MKITANRKEDILKRKAEYEAANEAYHKESDRRWREYRRAVETVTDPIKEELEYNLGKFSALQFRVDVEEGRWREPGLRVHISCDEDRKFNENVALAWSYDAHLSERDGQIVPVRESSSWSGLSATTEAQLESLRQTVKALDYLNSLDWNDLLNRTTPNYSDLFKDGLTQPEREDFEQQLGEAEIEDIIGKDKLIKVKNFNSSGYRGNEVYIKVISQTPSQYTVIARDPWVIENADRFQRIVDQGSFDDLRGFKVRKSSIHPVNPIQVVDIPQKGEVAE